MDAITFPEAAHQPKLLKSNERCYVAKQQKQTGNPPRKPPPKPRTCWHYYGICVVNLAIFGFRNIRTLKDIDYQGPPAGPRARWDTAPPSARAADAAPKVTPAALGQRPKSNEAIAKPLNLQKKFDKLRVTPFQCVWAALIPNYSLTP